MPYDNFDRFTDLVVMISIIGMWIITFGYGEWRYREGIREGRKQRRKLEREIRRGTGTIYRIK